MAKVLVVDDSEVARAMIADFLQMNGHEVSGEAENKAQAVAAYSARRPDLVTLDFSMGEDDGFTVLAALQGVDPAARVLVVSANGQRAIRDELMERGAKGYLAKPFTLAEMGEAVAKALAA